MKRSILLFCLAVITASAFADEPAVAECKQPIIPNKEASKVIVSLFDRHVKAYKKCLSEYIDQQQALAKTVPDVATANAAHDHAQAAIKEYNDFLVLIEERDRAAGKEADDDDKDAPAAKN